MESIIIIKGLRRIIPLLGLTTIFIGLMAQYANALESCASQAKKLTPRGSKGAKYICSESGEMIAFCPDGKRSFLGINGSYQSSANSSFVAIINGIRDPLCPFLGVNGLVQLDGKLVVRLNGFIPLSNQEFTIIRAKELIGAFNNGTTVSVLPRGEFDIVYGADSVTLVNFRNTKAGKGGRTPGAIIQPGSGPTGPQLSPSR